jgi:hypothetical protein
MQNPHLGRIIDMECTRQNSLILQHSTSRASVDLPDSAGSIKYRASTLGVHLRSKGCAQGMPIWYDNLIAYMGTILVFGRMYRTVGYRRRSHRRQLGIALEWGSLLYSPPGHL